MTESEQLESLKYLFYKLTLLEKEVEKVKRNIADNFIKQANELLR